MWAFLQRRLRGPSFSGTKQVDEGCRSLASPLSHRRARDSGMSDLRNKGLTLDRRSTCSSRQKPVIMRRTFKSCCHDGGTPVPVLVSVNRSPAFSESYSCEVERPQGKCSHCLFRQVRMIDGFGSVRDVGKILEANVHAIAARSHTALAYSICYMLIRKRIKEVVIWPIIPSSGVISRALEEYSLSKSCNSSPTDFLPN